jgi:hypothetical protein
MICARVGVFVLVAAACTWFEDTTKARMVKGAKLDKNFIVNSVEYIKIRCASSVDV